jgi:dihydroorotate dehydrogenase (fumarate)
MDLTTKYLGLRLAHPFMVGASPLAGSLDHVKRLEDGGSSAIVLPSLFEEQITMSESARIHHRDPLAPEFAAALEPFPPAENYRFTPDEYLEHLRRVKSAVGVPVIASLNGVTAETWAKFATNIEQAGADALELNIYEMATDPSDSSTAIETRIRDLVIDIKRVIAIPVAVKLSPFFTAFGHVARELANAGADGLIIFNRFYQPDINLTTLTTVPCVSLSTSAELLLRLRWLSALHGRVRCSLAAAGGVANPLDGIKALVSGADAVQMVSAILLKGPSYFQAMRKGLADWMASTSFETLDQARNALDRRGRDAELFERGSYIRTLQSWRIPDDVTA